MSKEIMPENWRRALNDLHMNDVRYFPLTLKDIREGNQVGSDFFTALKNLGVLHTFERDGREFPRVSARAVFLSAEQIRAQKWKDRKVQDERMAAAEKKEALIEEINRPENVCNTIGSTAENWKRSLQESGRWVGAKESAAGIVAEAIATVNAAGGTVVFNDREATGAEPETLNDTKATEMGLRLSAAGYQVEISRVNDKNVQEFFLQMRGQ
jgi:hypothetical protein